MIRRLAILSLIPAAFCLLSGFSLFESQDPDVEKGNKAYQDQEFPNAVGAYDRAIKRLGNAPEPHYDRGGALYKEGKHAEALESWLKALTQADEPLKARLYYNMGNALLQQGKLSEALDSYKRSLKLVPGDRDAIFNLELAQKILEEQKKKQQEQKDKDQNKDKDPNQDQNQNPDNQEKQDQKEQNPPDQADKDKKDQEQPKQEEGKEGEPKQEEPPKPEPGKEPPQAQGQPGQKGEANQAQPAQAVPVPKSEAERLLDQLKEQEKGFQMRGFMLEQQPAKPMEQDW